MAWSEELSIWMLECITPVPSRSEFIISRHTRNQAFQSVTEPANARAVRAIRLDIDSQCLQPVKWGLGVISQLTGVKRGSDVLSFLQFHLRRVETCLKNIISFVQSCINVLG